MLKKTNFFRNVNNINLKIKTRNYDFETFSLPSRYHPVTVFGPKLQTVTDRYHTVTLPFETVPYRSRPSATGLISRKVPYIENSHSSKLKYLDAHMSQLLSSSK